MPRTTLKIPQAGRVVIITIMTVQHSEDELYVDTYQCNEAYLPVGESIKNTVKANEVEYHQKLRADAIERGHYVPDFSTNREWDPGYVEYEEEPFECSPKDPDELAK